MNLRNSYNNRSVIDFLVSFDHNYDKFKNDLKLRLHIKKSFINKDLKDLSIKFETPKFKNI